MRQQCECGYVRRDAPAGTGTKVVLQKFCEISCEKCGNSGSPPPVPTVCSLILRHETEACSLFPVSKRSSLLPAPFRAARTTGDRRGHVTALNSPRQLYSYYSYYSYCCIGVLLFVSRTWIMARNSFSFWRAVAAFQSPSPSPSPSLLLLPLNKRRQQRNFSSAQNMREWHAIAHTHTYTRHGAHLRLSRRGIQGTGYRVTADAATEQWIRN